MSHFHLTKRGLHLRREVFQKHQLGSLPLRHVNTFAQKSALGKQNETLAIFGDEYGLQVLLQLDKGSITILLTLRERFSVTELQVWTNLHTLSV